MNEQESLARMVRPGAVRPGIWRGGVIQIWTTRICNLTCVGCTQGSNLGGKPDCITLENFEQACISLRGYHGVVGVFGGLPTMHPQFPELCEILRRHIPFERRGLWANNLKGHGKLCRETFDPSISNLNVHLDKEAAEEFRRDWPECRLIGEHEDSRHGPPFAALRDMSDLSDGQRWEMISGCEVNRWWSALFGQFRGQLRFWACELAGAQAMLHQNEPDYPDTGMAVFPTCWNLPMEAYASQVRKHCFDCGIPLKGYGDLATRADATEHVSQTHIDIFKPKKKERLVQLVTNTKEAQMNGIPCSTNYIQNSHLGSNDPKN